MADKSGEVSEAATCNRASASCEPLLPIKELPVTVKAAELTVPAKVAPAKLISPSPSILPIKVLALFLSCKKSIESAPDESFLSVKLAVVVLLLLKY